MMAPGTLFLFSYVLVMFFLCVCVCVAEEDYFVRWYNEEAREIFGEDSESLDVNGTFPTYLQGDLIRLGPSILKTDQKETTNFIDAFGRITKWTFSGNNNKVIYQSALIRSSLYNASANLTNIPSHITIEHMEPEENDIHLVPNLKIMDNTDVYVHKFEGLDEYLTFTDFHIANRIHGSTLYTLGNSEYNDKLNGTYSGSHYGLYYDKAVKEEVLVNWVGEPKAGGISLTVFKMGSNMVRHSVGSVDIKFTPYSIHAITVAGDYAFVVVGPVELEFLKTRRTLCTSCSTSDNIEEGTTMIYVFPLDSNMEQKVKEIESPQSFFAFHHVNGIINGDIAQIDLCTYLSMEGVIGENVLGNLRDLMDPDTRNSMASFCTNVWRLQIDIKENKVTSIEDIPIMDAATNVKYHTELISINPSYIGKPYCFFYSVTTHMNGSNKYEDIGILKVDVCGGKGVISSYYKNGVYLGEPIFVPNPQGVDEDDGVVLVLARYGEEDVSKMLVLDAKNLMNVLAEVTAPLKHMFEFHGKFFPLTQD